MEELKRQFPVLKDCIYANTPVFGPLYTNLYTWRQERDANFLSMASGMRNKTLETISEARTAVADYFDCKREDVGLLSNFSTGLNMLLEGLDKSEKVLLLENDYPSVDWPFASRGFQVSYASIDANLETNIREVVKKENITILALSVVQWQNGIKIDLEFLTKLKEEFPNLVIIADGTQFLGMTNFSFQNSAFDAIGASAYKWLLAGYGSGFMLFKNTIKERCALKTTGFNAANATPDKRNNIRFARRFEPGHLACSTFGSLKFSLDFLSAIGKDKIEQQNKRLSDKAKKEFSALGLLQASVVNRKEHSTIFNIKGNDALFQKLTENKVICAQRGAGIRLGFHFYNTEAEIDAIVEILKKK